MKTTNYLAIVFDDDAKAVRALHCLWKLDSEGDVTVSGATVSRRDNNGYVEAAINESDPGVRTEVGIGIRILLDTIVVPPNTSAVIAEVCESSTTPIDRMAKRLGGSVQRIAKTDAGHDAYDWQYEDYLYPFDYEPGFS